MAAGRVWTGGQRAVSLPVYRRGKCSSDACVHIGIDVLAGHAGIGNDGGLGAHDIRDAACDCPFHTHCGRRGLTRHADAATTRAGTELAYIRILPLVRHSTDLRHRPAGMADRIVDYLARQRASALVVGPAVLFRDRLRIDVWGALVTRRATPQFRAPSTSWDYRFIASASGVFQLLVIISSLPIAAEWTRSMSAPDDSWFVQGMKFAAFSLVITLAIPGLQLLLSHFLLEAHTHKRLVARACLLATFLVTFFGMFPATGGRLSKLAFELSGSGGRDCVVLFWAPDASPAIDALRNGSDKTSSIGVRLLFDADGSYIARVYTASNKSQVHFIPHAAVRAMGECEKPDAKKEIKAG